MLFQIAAVIGIARGSRQEFGFLPLYNHDHKDRFGSTEDVDLSKYFIHPLPGLDKSQLEFCERPYAWGYHDIYLPKGSWNITGHFQSERYFKHVMDEVQYYLKMKDEPAPFSPECCAIHVRLGDYDNHYHVRLDVDYYRRAIEQFDIKNTSFYVFSDEPLKAAEIIRKCFTGHVKIKSGGDYLGDFAMLKGFKNFICGNSSYSLMAAILSSQSDKKIVCPSNWFGPAWRPDTKDLYPEGAIVI